MKQLLFCYKENRKLNIRHNILTDIFVPVQDVISPQKTTLIVPQTNKIQQNDIVIIRDNESGQLEYVGYIDTLTNKKTTEISCYPLINVFDNDYVLDQMYKTVQQPKKKETTDANGNAIFQYVTDGNGNIVNEYVDISVDVIGWLKTQIENAFVNTDDSLQAIPFVVRNKTNKVVLHKKMLDTSNLLETYIDLFIETGVYVKFDAVQYEGNLISAIYCDIYCNTDEAPYVLKYDDPTIESIEIVDNTFTNYNKIIATEDIGELPEDTTDEQIEQYNQRLNNRERIYFYLLNDNTVTTNADDPNRIKQVRSKEITFKNATELSEEESAGKTDEEKKTLLAEKNARSLLAAVFNELQAPEYNLQITITMLKNSNIKLYRSVNFVSDKTFVDDEQIENVIYSTNITKMETINSKQVKIVLGALRNNLTDFKKKVEAI